MAWDSSARHGTNWKPRGYAKLRTERFAAHGDRCIDCGSHDRLELDHLDGNRDNWVPTNLGPRCHHHHNMKTQAEARAARGTATRPTPRHPGLR